MNSDNEFSKYIKRYCEDLANQSWQTIARATPTCECYNIYKQKAELEMYIPKTNYKERIGLTHFRRAPITLPSVKDKILRIENKTCPFCRDKCKADEYHLLVVCIVFQTNREMLLPQYYCNYPSLIKLDQLINKVKIDNLKNLFSAELSAPLVLPNLVTIDFIKFAVCTPSGIKVIKSTPSATF